MSDKNSKTPLAAREENLVNAYDGLRQASEALIENAKAGRGASIPEALAVALLGNVLTELRYIREDVALLQRRVLHVERRERGDLSGQPEEKPKN